MMRYKLLTVLVLSTLINTHSLLAETSQNDFRNTYWGMNPFQVITAEGKKPERDIIKNPIQILIYNDMITGLSCEVGYIFAYDQLVRAKYRISEEHTNKTAYLYDHEKLKEALTNKYGKPLRENTFWKNDLYKNDPSEYGLAVSLGHMTKFNRWETPETIIILALTGDNYKISLIIEYSSKKLKPIEEKAKEEQDKSKL